MDIHELFFSEYIKTIHFYCFQFISEFGDRKINVKFSKTTNTNKVTDYIKSEIGSNYSFKALQGFYYFPDIIFRNSEVLFWCNNKQNWIKK